MDQPPSSVVSGYQTWICSSRHDPAETARSLMSWHKSAGQDVCEGVWSGQKQLECHEKFSAMSLSMKQRWDQLSFAWLSKQAPRHCPLNPTYTLQTSCVLLQVLPQQNIIESALHDTTRNCMYLSSFFHGIIWEVLVLFLLWRSDGILKWIHRSLGCFRLVFFFFFFFFNHCL